ncbi:hypothetical protein E4195_06330 [Pseudomonas putida]|uniref:hypothetical protein n=1 Tax=Pseudomonas putida TaxID=303 RepID=UPI001074D395|nr:hypothetical protein [Pseudomonas putida]TFW38589.1 hypothetical protein E4195_06330 [Pseudomonas putida]
MVYLADEQTGELVALGLMHINTEKRITVDIHRQRISPKPTHCPVDAQKHARPTAEAKSR